MSEEKKIIYLDNNATTPLHPEVKKRIVEFLDYYGNPSSSHETGRMVKYQVNQARETIAKFFNCLPEEIIFTAGGSEANNTVLKNAINFCTQKNCACTAENRLNRKIHIITSNIEHPSVLSTLNNMIATNPNIEVTFIKVDEFGMVNPKDVEAAIRPETVLISIMYANNEIGTIEPIEEIAKIAKAHNIMMHTDAVQAVGKVKIDLSKLPVDFLSMSGHKVYAPKGIGILFKRKTVKDLCPLINGGHQEQALRAGTENTIGIIGLGEAINQLSKEMDEEIERVRHLRDKLQQGFLDNIPNIKINGHLTQRLPGTLNVSFKNIEGESILLRLDLYGIEVSTGSACSTGSLDPSHVITALGVAPEVVHSSIRFSLGRDTTEQDIDKVIKATKETVEFLRKISPLK